MSGLPFVGGDASAAIHVQNLFV